MNNLNFTSLNNSNLVDKITKYKLFDKRINYKIIDVNTCLGTTHILNAGNKNGNPIIIFHDENSTCKYCLNQYQFLLENYNVYICDITWNSICLLNQNYKYGEWASDIIESLEYKKMICIGESFGGLVVIKLMCFSPTKIIKSILISPYGIIKVNKIKVYVKNIIYKVLYKVTKKEQYLYKFIDIYMSCDEFKKDNIDLLKTVYKQVKRVITFSENINPYDTAMCLAPTLIFVGEEDKIFSSTKLLKKAKESFFNSSVYLIKNCSHIAFLSDRVCSEVNKEIFMFLKEYDDIKVIKYKDVIG